MFVLAGVVLWTSWSTSYRMSNSDECMGVIGEALQLHAVYKKAVFFCYKSRENPYQHCKSRKNPYQYYKSCENLYQVLQVMCATSEHAMKSKVRMINQYHHTTKLYWKKIPLICCHWYCYSCCTLVTIQPATNSCSWYSFVLWWYLYSIVMYYQCTTVIVHAYMQYCIVHVIPINMYYVYLLLYRWRWVWLWGAIGRRAIATEPM